jgi:hypothetical protein
MSHFALIPGALEAVPTHTWIAAEDVFERPVSRADLRAALKRAEINVKALRARLNPDA